MSGSTVQVYLPEQTTTMIQRLIALDPNNSTRGSIITEGVTMLARSKNLIQ